LKHLLGIVCLPKQCIAHAERSLKRRVARPGELDLEEVRETAMVLAQALPAHHG
jgi:hypothetical protein